MDFLMGVWNGWSSFFLLVLHIFGLHEYAFYDTARGMGDSGQWYDLGFLVGLLLNTGFFFGNDQVKRSRGR